jgi:hypothetical protein
MVVSPVGLGTKNHYAGEGQQQFAALDKKLNQRWLNIMNMRDFQMGQRYTWTSQGNHTNILVHFNEPINLYRA